MKKYQYHDVNFRGSIEKVCYMTTNRAGEPRDKYALVYLPHGYDAADREKRYNILYMMHGGGGNPDAWLDCCKVKNMLDYAIDAGELEPLIVVFPSYYKEKIPRIGAPDGEQERQHVLLFQRELVEELLPAVEGAYNVYASGTTQEALKAARRHRGFGGFSMGSATTWFAFMEHLDYFAYFVPLSGDCWAVEARGGASHAAETARILHQVALASGYGREDYFIYSATGTEDPACSALGPQIKEMKKYPDTFTFSEDFGAGNLHYFVAEGAVHAYECVYEYLYNYLPYLFQ